MGRFKFKKALFGLTTVTAAASLFAADFLLDNHEDGTNENELEKYWYYYDDFAGVKEDDRPTAAPESEPSEILVDYKKKEITLDNGDKHEMKDYEFKVETEDDNTFATMPFKYGEPWKASFGTAAPFVGIGTGLSSKTKPIDLSKATGVRFKMRSRGEPLTVTFQVETKTILERKTFDYHGIDLTATDEWDEFEVSFEELEQPGWTSEADEMELDLSDVVQLAWQVHGEKNDAITEGVLDLDDIYIIGEVPPLPSILPEFAEMDDTSSAYAFGTFEKKPKNQQPVLKTYWYAYDDGEIGGNSEVYEGATKSEETNRLNLEFEEGTGSDEKGTAPFLNFKLGDVITREEDGVKIKPFVGIGINVYDSATCRYWDASDQDYIYFHYMTAGAGIKKATLEISDINDVPDKDNPDRKDMRGSGVVWYLDLPNTNEKWKAAKVKFSQLVTHEDWDVYNDIPLDKSKLAKIQFKVQGDMGTEGFLAIDNVYFGKPISTPVLSKLNKVDANAFAASYRNGKININWTGKTAIAEGKISLIDVKGCVVQSSSIVKTSRVSNSISANTLASGVYIVKLNGIDVNGKAISMKSSLSVIK